MATYEQKKQAYEYAVYVVKERVARNMDYIVPFDYEIMQREVNALYEDFVKLLENGEKMIGKEEPR